MTQVPTEFDQSTAIHPLSLASRGLIPESNVDALRTQLFELEEGITRTVSANLLENRTRLAAATDNKAIITAYYSLVDGLSAMRDQWQELIDATCSIYGPDETKFTATKANEVSARSIKLGSALRHDVKLAPLRLDRIVTAKFAARPEYELTQLLLQHCDALVDDFARHCVGQLVRLVELRVVGAAQWFGNNCQYAYFSREFSSKESMRFVKETDRVEQWWHDVETIQEVFAHEHHLIDARREPAKGAKTSMPAAVRKLIEDSPTWILDQLELITGTLVLENIALVETKSSTSTRLEELPKVAFDPALTIGPFVLTGWGPRDEARIVAELEKEELVDDEIRSYLAVGAVVFGLLLIIFGSSLSRPDLVGMACLAVAGICIGTLSRERLIRSTGSATRANMRLAAAVLGCLLVAPALNSSLAGMLQLSAVLVTAMVVAAVIFVLSDPRSIPQAMEQIRGDANDA